MAKHMRRQNPITARNPRNIPHLASRVFGTPLFVDGRKLDAILPVFTSKINGEPSPQVSDSDYRDDGGNMSINTDAGIAVIPIIGSLIRRPTWLDVYSGLTSYNDIGECIDSALNDARVKGILLQLDSMGGEAAGCFELCDRIYASRGNKPIWAVADVDALSAGYAILSCADRVFCDPAGSVGSIGVVAVHCERSQYNQAMGITYTVFRAGDRKAEFNPYEKLTSAASLKMLASMEKMRDRFANTVSRNRGGLAIATILETEGQWYDPDDAKELGLIDDILTFDQAFSQLATLIAQPPAANEPPDDDAPEPPSDPPQDDEQETGGGGDPETDPDNPDDDPETDPEEQASEVISMADPNKPNAGAAIPPAKPNAQQPPAPVAQQPAVAEVVSLDSARPNAESRETQIAHLCKVAGMPHLTTDFILDPTKSAEDVRTALVNIRAEENGKSGELSNSHPGNRITGFAPQQSAAAVESWGGAFKSARMSNPVGFPQLQNRR